MKTLLLAAILALALVQLSPTVRAYPDYQSLIPNGKLVPSPCPGGGTWPGVGHQGSAGGNMRNPFGLAFKAAGSTWTQALCRADSDGDGVTNGQELGDPDCVWTPGATPARTTGLSHPGICPLDSTTCINSWTVCPKAFNCPGMTEPGVVVRNFTLNVAAVPPKPTTYICQAFELNNTASAVHSIGSRPLIMNKNVMHHMIMYACSKRPAQTMFDGPQECFMGNADCTEIINLWGFGVEGECFNNNTGVRIGGTGYRYAMLQLHWNNPMSLTGYTDGSGFSMYFTSRLRPYDQGTLMYGEVNLVLPPRQALISYNHTCPGVCTNRYHSETRYITSAVIHMHTYGIKGRISLWRNGSLVKDLSPMQAYEYDSPMMIHFDPPVEYRRGDEVKTECYFSTLRTNTSIFWGEGTNDEMCFSFISYYPNNVSLTTTEKLGDCLAGSGLNICWLRSGIAPQVEQGCDITAVLTTNITSQVLADMTANRCFAKSGCEPTCRNYLTNTLWPSNACYDPNRARQMLEFMVLAGIAPNPINQTIVSALYGQRFCEQELTALANLAKMAAVAAETTAAPTAQPSASAPRLTSEHLLIIIIVCSCLGFIIILAVLGLLASKVCNGGGGGGGAGAASAPAPAQTRPNMYKVYDNSGMDPEKTNL